MSDLTVEELMEEYHGKSHKVEEFEPPERTGGRKPTKAGVEKGLDKLSEEEQKAILAALMKKLGKA